MKAFINESDDITCRLRESELEYLSQIKDDFFSNCLMTNLQNSKSRFYLGYSSDIIFNHITPTNNVQVQLPVHLGDPYLVNLKDEAYKSLKKDKELSLRYPGGAKLFIFVKND